jgi:hypothetical protein
MSGAVAILGAVLALFVLRPSVPGNLNAALFHDPAEPDAGLTLVENPPMEVQRLLTEATDSARSDREWLDRWYEGQLDASRVKSMEEERFFAVRRFELTTGKRIVIFSEIGGDPSEEPMTEVTAVRQF